MQAAKDVKGAVKEAKRLGIRFDKLVYSWHALYFPHVNMCELPHDIMHLFADGLLRSECAWLFFVLHRLGLQRDAVNSAIRLYPRWPADVRIPNLHPNLSEGTGKGNSAQPKSSRTMRMSASQMGTFAAHSIELLAPILTPEMKAHPAWASWLKLVELYTLVTLHKLTLRQVRTVDDLQAEHSRLFDEVHEYRRLKRPKHHSLTHLAHEIWRFGPPRGYHSFGFEHMNSILRLGAQHSNLANEAEGIAAYWSMRQARFLSTGREF